MDVEEEANSDDEDWENVVASNAPHEPTGAQPAVGADVGEWFVERAKYIPIRLGLAERKYLRLLEAALSVSEYTDKVGSYMFERGIGLDFR